MVAARVVQGVGVVVFGNARDEWGVHDVGLLYRGVVVVGILETWSGGQVGGGQRQREADPRWGKDKLRVLLARQGVQLSVSMVGRILATLKRRGDLIEPPLRRISARKRLLARPHAVRKPKDYAVQAPGDLVQLDTVDVQLAGTCLKQFTARDYVSRYDVLTLRSQATAGLAAQGLQAILERMPFSVRAIQCKSRGSLSHS